MTDAIVANSTPATATAPVAPKPAAKPVTRKPARSRKSADNGSVDKPARRFGILPAGKTATPVEIVRKSGDVKAAFLAKSVAFPKSYPGSRVYMFTIPKGSNVTPPAVGQIFRATNGTTWVATWEVIADNAVNPKTHPKDVASKVRWEILDDKDIVKK